MTQFPHLESEQKTPLPPDGGPSKQALWSSSHVCGVSEHCAPLMLVLCVCASAGAVQGPPPGLGYLGATAELLLPGPPGGDVAPWSWLCSFVCHQGGQAGAVNQARRADCTALSHCSKRCGFQEDGFSVIKDRGDTSREMRESFANRCRPGAREAELGVQLASVANHTLKRAEPGAQSL